MWGYKRVVADSGERKLEHRYIMEQYLGRELLSSELVHHKNGNLTDNNIENLEVISRVEHARYHGLNGDYCKLTGRKTSTSFESGFDSRRNVIGKNQYSWFTPACPLDNKI